MLFSAIGISITMLTLLVAHNKTQFHKLLVFPLKIYIFSFMLVVLTLKTLLNEGSNKMKRKGNISA
jgi:hypothetical protein